tara:strand:+ start:2687 stop:3697 length:1011 start_codon:yes stop_codon:yes gene_type:complete
MINYKSNRELLEILDNIVIGHPAAKKTLINIINRSRIRYHQAYRLGFPDDKLIEPGKCVLVGDSGTGKTFMINTLRDLVGFPLVKLDASDFIPMGAGSGTKSSDIFKAVRANAVDEINKPGPYLGQKLQLVIDQTVVFVDEIDKLSTHYDGNSGSWNQHTQTNFLSIFESTDNMYKGVSFIFAGAFSSIKEDEERHRPIGFSHDLVDALDVTKEVTDLDIIKYGFIPEFVGRMGSIVLLDKFTEEEYRTILLDKVLPKKREDLIHFNCADLELTDEQIDGIVKTSMESGQGIRSLNREVDKLVQDIEFYYEDVSSHRLLLENLLDKDEEDADQDIT